MKTSEEMQAEWDVEIAKAGVQTEKEMRDSEPPTPKTLEELTAYLETLVERPHDYGTCVYAMSHAAVAAFNFVAGRLGVTGFQASVADLDVLRWTRGLERGAIADYKKLLYPQCLDEFRSARELLVDPEIRPWLAKKARELLADRCEYTSSEVARHWKMLADWPPRLS